MIALRPNKVVLGALAVAAVGGLGIVISARQDPVRALLGWVAAYGFGIGTVLGALLLVMIFHLTRASWPLVVRPLLMAICATTPIFAVLFVPIALGTRAIYPWSSPLAARLQGEPLGPELSDALEHQRAWNTPAFFLVRSALYLATWIVLAVLLRRADQAAERSTSEDGCARQRVVSAVGVIVLAFTLTFAAFDWFMSLEPGWVANMYGLYFFAGGLASAVSLVVVLAWAASRSGRIEGLQPDHFHALGRLMLMATVFWGYIGFFQLMLVWIADLPREASFYVARSRGSYETIDWVLVFGHFVLPFLALLSRPLKRRAGLLALVAAWLITMDAIDVAWLVLPSAGVVVGVADLAPFLFIGGLVLAYGTQQWQAPRAPALPALTASLEYRSS